MGLIAICTSNMVVIYTACAITIPSINRLQYNTLIHHSIRSVERGTVLSTRAMVGTLCGAQMLIVAKFLLDGYGIATTLVFLLVMSGTLFWILNKVRKVIKKTPPDWAVFFYFNIFATSSAKLSSRFSIPSPNTKYAKPANLPPASATTSFTVFDGSITNGCSSNTDSP